MKVRLLISGIFIAGAVAFFLVRSPHKPNAGVITPELKANSSETRPQDFNDKPGNVIATNDPLAGAYQTAAFVDQVLVSVPVERHATRTLLKGLQVAFFLNDYVMAAKTNQRLALTTSAIVDAFTNVTQDTSNIKAKLATYADFPGTLSDHYQSISEIPRDKDNIKAIKAALTENGVTIDTEGDLLMDCIRYAYHNDFFHEMYGTSPKQTIPATPYPTELNALIKASDTVYKHRFETRFGLSQEAVANLLNRLKKLPVYDVSPSGFEIPAHIR